MTLESPVAMDASSRFLKWNIQLLAGIVWLSAFIFGLYILAFYFIALLQGNTAQWNNILPGLYDAQTKTATWSIGIHFAGGGLILILGCIQLIDRFRKKHPSVHRWIGRVYILASLATALGGLAFIFLKGTIGGTVMDIGFTGYGVLMFYAAVQTIRHARSRRFDQHRAWALRLFALAIGSWLYRMDYGFWMLTMDGWGHSNNFQGPFDHFMSFWFYLPNLLVAEIIIRRQNWLTTPISKWMASGGLFLCIAFFILATFFFTKHYWGPAIVGLW